MTRSETEMTMGESAVSILCIQYIELAQKVKGLEELETVKESR